MSKNYVKSRENVKYNYLGVVSKLGEALLLWNIITMMKLIQLLPSCIDQLFVIRSREVEIKAKEKYKITILNIKEEEKIVAKQEQKPKQNGIKLHMVEMKLTQGSQIIFT